MMMFMFITRTMQTGLIMILLWFYLSMVSVAYASEHHPDSAPADAQELVLLLHGLGRSNIAMWRLADRLEDANYKVQRIGYHSIGTTLAEVLTDITGQINQCCAEDQRKIHLVGHSLGGLLIRAYLQDNQLLNLGRVVLIGTPNKGTEIANWLGDNPAVKLLTPIAAELSTHQDSFPNRLPLPYYPVGVIAGVVDRDNENYLPGRDDGMVSVESTKLEGMRDFIEISSGHSMMRYNDEVAQQAINFLQQGRFYRP